MAQSKATRATIYLTNVTVVTGWLYQNRYMMSGTDATRVIRKSESSIRSYMQSKASKSLSDKDKITRTVTDFEGSGNTITLYTTNAVKEYWLHWCIKGDKHAAIIVKALMSTDLDRLFDVAFQGEQRSESEYQNTRTLIEQLVIARDLCRARHPGFQMVCQRDHYPACRVHDRMTLMLAGMNAHMARQLEAILDQDSDIGLDHYQCEHELALRQLAVTKRIFTGMCTPGFTWQEQVDRAVKRAQKEVPA